MIFLEDLDREEREIARAEQRDRHDRYLELREMGFDSHQARVGVFCESGFVPEDEADEYFYSIRMPGY